ncbi:hypothetical protein EZV62_021803 [Acer yangbiense]|uniref:rhamnogalacturonan endolyase n=1 Tax=Acer yangbiense TaxID=1000413 RepID=A0A5C7H6M4_9ROSI|nr:hypothetical protein EZV62_021803 [Acer yangbiense]
MCSLLVLFLISLQWLLILPLSSLGLQLHIQDKHVIMENGIVDVTISNPQGMVTGIRFNGIDNLLEVRKKESDRGYWDLVWEGEGSQGKKGTLDRFHYMAVAENRKREMPLPDDRLSNRSQTLAYPEAVLLVNPIEPQFKGEVDDKYQYTCDSKDAILHGWISSSSSDPPTGFWQITPSNEFRSAGPTKQYMTSHVGPISLTIMHSTHYAGSDLIMNFGSGEPWKKVFGPVFVYVNSLTKGSDGDPQKKLWEDANKQKVKEVQNWPYNFIASKDFPPSDQRGSINGRLMLQDGKSQQTVLMLEWHHQEMLDPGKQNARANADGSFSINNIRTGNYNLYAWIPGFIGDYKYDGAINISPGSHANMDNLVYKPPRDGPTLWEIGIPDRSAAEFYVPDPNPKYINKLYVNHPDRFRQYGLWERYSELYPEGDLVYTVGVSNYRKDWFFAQVTRPNANNLSALNKKNVAYFRKKPDNTYQGTTWQVKFKLNKINKSGIYKLRLALATANDAQLQVRVNNPSRASPLFSTGQIGHDNTIARHGIHGLYRLFNVDVQGSLLVEGDNTIFLTQTESVVMENEMLQVTLSNPDGIVTGICFHDIENLLEVGNDEFNRGYWDLVWSKAGSPGTKGTLDRIEATNFTVIEENEEKVELSFTRLWNSTLEGKQVPLNIDKRFIMLRGSSGFYTYAIFERLAEWPAFNIDNIRMAFKLNKDKFHYMAIADDRQRFMPLPDDRLHGRGQALAYPEAVLLVNPVEPEFKGEVDDKYQYSCKSEDIRVHGWISTDGPPVGFWQITPSIEFRSAGPLKQYLTSHVGPTTLALFHSVHYSGADLILRFQQGEPWKKVFGPIFIYINSLLDGDDPLLLWEDAKQQMMMEVESWPYDFPASEDFPSLDQRGSVSGRLLVQDRYVSNGQYISANAAYVGLAAPGDAGSWQRECKGYQFWTRADADGYFSISNIRTGNYSLYAWVPGFIGDYRYDFNITLTESCDIDIGDLVYEPPRHGPTLWEIGIPDRSAAEFYVPDPDPGYINKLYVNHSDRYRQYGLWDRYAEQYPEGDLIYTVNIDNYTKDWKKDNKTYEGTTWQIKFELKNVNESAIYKLRLALATAHVSELQVRINDPSTKLALFSTGQIGKENTIARHGIYGLYWLFNVEVPGTLFFEGNNTIYLTQTLSISPFQGVVMDNGILQVTLSKPDGIVTGIQYKGIDNLLEFNNKEEDRGYWDHDWNYENSPGGHDRIISTNYSVIVQTAEQVELSFTRMWYPSSKSRVIPLNIDKRFVMLRGSSGFYSYAIHEHFKGWPALNIANVRMAFKLSQDKFQYMAIADNKQRDMPSAEDRLKGQKLAYPEAVLLVNPKKAKFKGEVDDKYQYSMESRDINVHGWISNDPAAVGFWQITPSSESTSFGPFKQLLTSHVGPTSLTTFHSSHYVGRHFEMKIKKDEAWKKVYGPFFVYVNSLPGRGNKHRLWEDAKKQYNVEVKSWPYKFPASKDFPQSDQRGSISGRLIVLDRYVSRMVISAKGAYVGLANPGSDGTWQTESKGYQFWTVTYAKGYFWINNVRTGKYILYAFVPGFIGDYKHNVAITITAGSVTKIGKLVYKPPRVGPTYWEIGYPDRSATEFYIPDPNLKYVNRLFVNQTTERFRQYGLWDRYSEIYPTKDLVFTVGVSDYRKDWRKNKYVGTTWEIKFNLNNANKKAKYKLRLALASATFAELQVRVNDPYWAKRPVFSTGQIGDENAIARHGIHGVYRLYNVDLPGSLLVKGSNSIFLTQSRGGRALIHPELVYIPPPKAKGIPMNIDKRMVFKLSQDKFKYMTIADNKQRDMPSAKDQAKGRKLAYPEAVLLINPKETKLKREVLAPYIAQKKKPFVN